jgi:hypothetical protein
MDAHRLSPSDVRAAFLAETVLHNSVSGACARIIECTPELLGKLLALPGAVVVGPRLHRGQDEHLDVADGVTGYRCGAHRGELRAGEAVAVTWADRSIGRTDSGEP